MDKICEQCKQVKDSKLDFYWSNGRTRSICKDCVKANEKERYKARVQEIQEFKQTLGCKKCGETRSYLLDFHHRDPKEKDFCISDFSRTPLSSLMKEIEKCDILCANCHREWHYLSQQNKDLDYNVWLGE